MGSSHRNKTETRQQYHQKLLSFLFALWQLPMDTDTMDGLENMLHQCVQKKFVQPVKIMDLPLIKQSWKPIVINNVTNVNSVLEMLLKLYQNAKKFCMNGAWACARNCNMGKHKCLYC